MFGELPVRDAKVSIAIVATAADKKGAVQGDIHKCVLTNSCRRMYGSTAVVFTRTKAYVDMPDENNQMVIERFVLPSETRKQAAKLDKTKEFTLGRYMLNARTPGATLDHKLVRERVRREEIASGKRTVTFRGPNKTKKLGVEFDLVRSGIGRTPLQESSITHTERHSSISPKSIISSPSRIRSTRRPSYISLHYQLLD